MRRKPRLVIRGYLAALPPLLLVLGPAPASGAESPNPGRETVALVTSVVTPIFGAYLLQGEIRASRSFAVIVNASYLGIEKDDWKLRAGTVGAGVDYYFGGDGLRGWHAEAIGEAWLASWRHEPSSEVAPMRVGYAAVALFGYQFVCDLGPVLDIGAGAVAFHVPSTELRLANAPVSSGALDKVYPAVKVDLGWAF